MKKFSKILIIFFLFLTIFLGMSFLNPAKADETPTWNFEVPSLPSIGSIIKLTNPVCSGSGENKICEVPWIGQLIDGIFRYAIGFVGILAAIALMLGGIIWVTAGGSAGRVTNAKNWIKAGLTGLIIALASYMILYQINPDLVNFKPLKIKIIEHIEAPEKPIIDEGGFSCEWASGSPPVSCPNGKDEASGGGKCDETKLPSECIVSGSRATCLGGAIAAICCCEPVTTGTGQCESTNSGPCAVSELSIFGSKAEEASAICMAESGGKASIGSSTDKCDGQSVSWGLFQINIMAWSIGGHNCPSAFSGKMNSSNCMITKASLYKKCVSAAQTASTNINKAYNIYKRHGWGEWGANRKCGF